MSITANETNMMKQILKEEMLTALGCTEPIAIAYAAAKAKEVLGQIPEKITVWCSGNLIKNAKAVTVPMTIDMKGIEAAAVVGAVGGCSDKELEVLTTVTPQDLAFAKELLNKGICDAKYLQTPAKLHIIVKCEAGESSSQVEILHSHTAIVKIEKDEKTIFEVPHDAAKLEESGTDKSFMSIEKIYEFCNAGDLEGVNELFEHAIDYNMKISQEGLDNPWGAQVGRTLLEEKGNGIRNYAIAAAAAGSDARMSGCELGVVINSGSGNQGITVTVPLVTYARHLGSDKEKTYRALAFANLIGIYQKSKIGRLSAFCGAVSAGCSTACGIAYLQDAPLSVIEQTIVNTLANVGGIVCDGAKPSCAAKIASSVDAALMGYEMALKNRGFQNGEGLVKQDIEATIDSFCRMAKIGMEATDDEILRIMVEC